MKNIDYKQLKLKKYDVGKRQDIFSGYQQGEQVDTSSFSSTPAQQFGDYAKGIRGQIAPLAISQGTQLLGNLAGTISQIPGLSSSAANVLGKASSLLGGGASNITNSITNAANASGSAASGAVSGMLSAGSAGLGALGLVNSGIGLANAISAFSDPVVTSSDALNSMGRSTQSKYGVNYTTYTGLDKKGIRETVEAANSRDKTNLTMQGANTGMALGGLIGGLAGGPFGVVGAGLGLLTGLFGGLFGGSNAAWEREKKANRMIKNVMYATGNYNRNEEAEAGSQGLRNQFYNQHVFGADKGKDVHTNFGKPGKIKTVHTANGIEPGIELGVAGGKESIVDFKENTASVIEEGKKRVDNISVGIPLDSNSTKQDWDNDVFIAGNVKNPYTGNTIAEDAEPYAKNVEKINKQNPMTSLGKKTKEINLRNQMEQLRWLSDVQSAVKQAESYYANCGKMPKHKDGLDPMFDFDKLVDKYLNKKIDLIPGPTPKKSDQLPYYTEKQNSKFKFPNLNGLGEYAMTLLPHIAQIGYLATDNTDYTPRSYNPYVASNYDKYVNNIRSRRLDPSQALKNAEKASLQNRYATTHQGGLSAGQIAALSNISNLATASAKNNILADYAQKNIALANEADRLGMQANMSEAGRRQQANTNWYEWLMRSGSAANNLKQANRKAMYDQIGAIGSDLLSMFQYNQARALQNKKIDLFDKAMNL